MNVKRSALPSVTGIAPASVVDAHMHVGEFPLFNVCMDADGLAETFRHYGIEAGMVFHPDNRYVRDVVEAIDGAYGLVWCNPHKAGFVEEAVELFEHPKFLGVKLHPLLDAFHPNDPALHPLIEQVVARGLPVLIHCGHPIFTLPWSIEELAVSFPEAKIILGHMGHGNIVYINGAIDVAERNTNVYLETSGMPMHTKIAEAVERAGATKVLYGSDAPFHEVGVEIRKVQVSGLSPELVARVLEKNSRLLFFGHEDATAPLSRTRR
ncbi:MAG: metal-dependent hydrolase [Chloroflexi bacterium]|nr:MAG: metal-dependent hydrolase [Chloroflexota bacterium]